MNLNRTKKALTVLCLLTALFAVTKSYGSNSISTKKSNKMKVEIWSDVMCPFCYIGKRKFEAALSKMPERESVEVIWKSFQLQPDLKTDPTKNTVAHLAESKGWTMAYTNQAIAHVVNMAEEVGLNYNFDKAVVANSFDAHRISHYAASQGKGDKMEEQLFKAYFIDGKNTADHTTLTQLAVNIGLNEEESANILKSDKYTEEVRKDIYEASQIGVSGVPYFVFNDKYAVSGAQDSKVFLEVLQKSFSEWKNAHADKKLEVKEGAVCTPKGDCK